MKTQPREGWWFSDDSGVLPHGDGRAIILGQKLSVKGKLVICQNALHGSFDPFDALQYAPGQVLHRVLFSGARIEEGDKVGSRSRTVLATRDAEGILHLFARRQALSVIHLWNPPTVVREYLETGDKTKRSAAALAAADVADADVADADAAAADADADAAAACYAASAARHAANADADAADAADAACFAADAACNAACNAATDAACNAATDAATDAAWDNARAAACQMFNDMVKELFNDARENKELVKSGA